MREVDSLLVRVQEWAHSFHRQNKPVPKFFALRSEIDTLARFCNVPANYKNVKIAGVSIEVIDA